MATRSLYVFIYLPGERVGTPAGRLRYDEGEAVGEFAYGRRYLERPDAIAVDPVALPLGGEARVAPATLNRGLFGAFRDAAPDYWGRLVIAAERKAPLDARRGCE